MTRSCRSDRAADTSTWNRACNIEQGETSLDADREVDDLVGRAAVGAFNLVGSRSGPFLSLSLLLGPGGTLPPCEELEGEGQGRSDLLHLPPIDGWRRGEG